MSKADVQVTRGDSPVILCQPHGGTWLPDAVFARLNATGRALADTDWHIDRLYEGLLPGATVIAAQVHRYVIDVNRDPGGVSLYPGQNTTGLCPTTDFEGRPIWEPGQEPGPDEIAERTEMFHAPYHAVLAEEIARQQARHGMAIVYDCHSIRSRIPFLFDGVLPVFSIGTNGGSACDPAVREAVRSRCALADGLTHVVDGRFKGGWTTRHWGRPQDGIHAIQMEMTQDAYLAAEAPPWSFDALRAGRVRSVLAALLADLDRLARAGVLTNR
jgi:formiminoglutamase